MLFNCFQDLGNLQKNQFQYRVGFFRGFFTALANGTCVNSVADLQVQRGHSLVSGLGLHFKGGGWKMILSHSAQEGASCYCDTGMC